MQILVDIGSSTVKACALEAGKLQVLKTKSVPFKKSYREDSGNEAGVAFEVIDQNAESRYLELALAGRYNGKEPVLLINIGGESTELVVLEEGKGTFRQNLDVGVGTILAAFPTINHEISEVTLDEAVAYISKILPSIQIGAAFAIYSGGELSYMRLTGYALVPNTRFMDSDHPSIISDTDFIARNREIFEKVRLSAPEALMPENPSWMHGARACSALAQAICTTYNIREIVPSNSNLLDGVARSLSETILT